MKDCNGVEIEVGQRMAIIKGDRIVRKGSVGIVRKLSTDEQRIAESGGLSVLVADAPEPKKFMAWVRPQDIAVVESPGAETDAKIAEMMGWEWMERDNQERAGVVRRKALLPPENDPEWRRTNYYAPAWTPAKPETQRFSDWNRCGCREVENNRVQFGVPHYSTDPAPADELQRWLVGQGYIITTTTRKAGSIVTLDRGEGQCFTAEGDTWMLAQSRAALMAKEKSHA